MSTQFFTLSAIIEEEISKEAEQIYSRKVEVKSQENRKVTELVDEVMTIVQSGDLEKFQNCVNEFKLTTNFLEDHITPVAIKMKNIELLHWLHIKKGVSVHRMGYTCDIPIVYCWDNNLAEMVSFYLNLEVKTDLASIPLFYLSSRSHLFDEVVDKELYNRLVKYHPRKEIREEEDATKKKIILLKAIDEVEKGNLFRLKRWRKEYHGYNNDREIEQKLKESFLKNEICTSVIQEDQSQLLNWLVKKNYFSIENPHPKELFGSSQFAFIKYCFRNDLFKLVKFQLDEIANYVKVTGDQTKFHLFIEEMEEDIELKEKLILLIPSMSIFFIKNKEIDVKAVAETELDLPEVVVESKNENVIEEKQQQQQQQQEMQEPQQQQSHQQKQQQQGFSQKVRNEKEKLKPLQQELLQNKLFKRQENVKLFDSESEEENNEQASESNNVNVEESHHKPQLFITPKKQTPLKPQQPQPQQELFQNKLFKRQEKMSLFDSDSEGEGNNNNNNNDEDKSEVEDNLQTPIKQQPQPQQELFQNKLLNRQEKTSLFDFSDDDDDNENQQEKHEVEPREQQADHVNQLQSHQQVEVESEEEIDKDLGNQENKIFEQNFQQEIEEDKETDIFINSNITNQPNELFLEDSRQEEIEFDRNKTKATRNDNTYKEDIRNDNDYLFSSEDEGDSLFGKNDTPKKKEISLFSDDDDELFR